MDKVTIEQILEIIEKANIVKDSNTLVHEQPLAEQGVDSLDFSSLLFNMEEVFGVVIPDEDVDGLLTINDILVYVNTKV